MDDLTKHLKTKYKKILTKLGADLTLLDTFTLITYDQHLQDKELLKSYQPQLKVDSHKQLYEVLTPNEQTLEKERLSSNYKTFDTFNLPAIYKDVSFDEYLINTPKRKELFKLGQDFLQKFKQNKKGKGLYISGENRVGKTFFAACLAHEIAKESSLCFLSYPDFSRTIQSTIVDNRLEETINMLKNVSVLVIDDFGQGRKSSWLRDAVMLPLINYRLALKLPIIYTSNYQLKDMVDILALNDASESRTNNSEQVAVSIVTRINEATTQFELNNENESE